MIQREFKKLWQKNIASIRDLELERAINEGGMVFIYKGKIMTKTSEQLKRDKFQCHKQKIKSKRYPDQSYTLYDFVFVEDSKVDKDDKKQLTLL